MTSWQTIVFGALSAIGLYLTQLQGAPSWVPIVGQAVSVLSTFLAGIFHPTTTVGVVNASGVPATAANNPPKS